MPSPTLSSVQGLRQNPPTFAENTMPHHRTHARPRRRPTPHARRRHYSPLRLRPGAYSDASYSAAYRSPPHSPPDSLSGGSPFSGIERVATPQWRGGDFDLNRRDFSPRARSAPYFGRAEARNVELVFRQGRTLIVKQRMATGTGLPADRDGTNRGLPWLSICEQGTGRVLLSAHGELGDDVEVKDANGNVVMVATRRFNGGEERWDEIRVDDLDGGMVVDARLSDKPRRALALSGRTGRSRSRSRGRSRSRSRARSQSRSRGTSLSLGEGSLIGSEDWIDIRGAGYGMPGLGSGGRGMLWGDDRGGGGRYGHRNHGLGRYGMGRHGIGGYGNGGYGMDGYGMEGYGMEGYGMDGYGMEGYGMDGYGMEGYGMERYDERVYGMRGQRLSGYGTGSRWRGRSRSRSRSVGGLGDMRFSRDRGFSRERSVSRGPRSATPRYMNRARSLSRGRMSSGHHDGGSDEFARRGWSEREDQEQVGMGTRRGRGVERWESDGERGATSGGLDERLWRQGQQICATNFGNYTNGRRQFTSDGRIDPDYFQRLRYHNSPFLNNPYSDMLTAAVMGRGENGIGSGLGARGVGLGEDLGEDGERIMEYFGGKSGEFWLVRSSDFMRENFEGENGVLGSVCYFSVEGGGAGEACYQMFLQGGVDLVMIVGAMVARLWIAKVTDGVYDQ